jgi:dihydrofolate reductase
MSADPKLVLIAAVAQNGVIGSQNDLPWGRSIPRDMARFRDITERCVWVLMGRNTAMSLGKPLPRRRNLVLTSGDLFLHPGFIRDAAADPNPPKAIAVIGGEQIYRLCAPYASLAYLTRVHTDAQGDAFFPVDVMRRYTRKGALETHPSDEKNAFALDFMTLQNTHVKSVPLN